MPLAGNLRQYALPEVLRTVETGQRTGALVLSRGRLRAVIYFSGGQWLLGERVGSGQVLAQQLARIGLITPEQFEAALGVPFAQAGSITDAQVVRGLVGSGLLSQEQLRTFAVDDAVALLSVVVGWPDGDFTFDDGVPLPTGRVALPLPVMPLVAQAMRLARKPAPAYEPATLTPDMIIEFADVEPDSGIAVQLTREQWRLLTAVDGRMPLWAIIQRLNAPEGAILRIAGELVALGIGVVVGRDGARMS